MIGTAQVDTVSTATIAMSFFYFLFAGAHELNDSNRRHAGDSPAAASSHFRERTTSGVNANDFTATGDDMQQQFFSQKYVLHIV